MPRDMSLIDMWGVVPVKRHSFVAGKGYKTKKQPRLARIHIDRHVRYNVRYSRQMSAERAFKRVFQLTMDLEVAFMTSSVLRIVVPVREVRKLVLDFIGWSTPQQAWLRCPLSLANAICLRKGRDVFKLKQSTLQFTVAPPDSLELPIFAFGNFGLFYPRYI